MLGLIFFCRQDLNKRCPPCNHMTHLVSLDFCWHRLFPSRGLDIEPIQLSVRSAHDTARAIQALTRCPMHSCRNLRDFVQSPSRLDARAILGAARPQLCAAAARRLRVWAAFFAEAERSANDRTAEAAPPLWPPFLAGAVLLFLPRPEPLFLPPPVILFTVAQARRAASSS